MCVQVPAESARAKIDAFWRAGNDKPESPCEERSSSSGSAINGCVSAERQCEFDEVRHQIESEEHETKCRW